MSKIKRFIDVYIPVEACTLRCHYCYITHHRLFNNRLPKFKYSPEHVRQALSKERLGGICLINLCGGGETLLPPEVPQYIRALLEEGHFVMVVTNATVSKRFDEIAQFPKELLKRLFFKFSYHYLELKSRSLLERFWKNIQKVRNVGCSFTLEVTPSDELIPYIDELQQIALENVGSLCHITVARDERDSRHLPILTNLHREEYIKTWSSFNSTLFDYKISVFGVKRKEFCYAGDWSFTLNLGTGIMAQCYCSLLKQNIFEDIEKDIEFIPIGNNCRERHCYNAHAFLALGNIPELLSPTYAYLRNRVCNDGSEWLSPDMKEFMNGKLYELNVEYTDGQKRVINKIIKRRQLKMRCELLIKRILQR